MNLLYLPPILFSLFGIHLSGTFGESGSLWVYFFSSGLILNLFLQRKVEIRAPGLPLLFLTGSLLLTIVLPFPFKIGPLLLFLSLILYLLGKSVGAFEMLAKGLFLSGVEVSLVLLFVPLLDRLSSYVHDVNFLSPFYSGVFKIFGYESSFSSGSIFVRTMRDLQQLTPRFESLGIYFFVLLLVSLSFLVLSLRKLKQFIYLLSIIILYCLVRFFLLGTLYLESEVSSLLFKEPFLSASVIPIFLFLQLIKVPKVKVSLEKVSIPLILLSFLFMSSSLFFLSLHDPGVPKKGRLLIDEFHSDWEWTTKKYDTDWYGPQSGYNYYSYADFLDHYFNVKSSFEPLSDDILRGVDVLIVKTPTDSFSLREIESIVSFVQRGGGLFVIGDHTNVFGSTTYLNPLLKRFGLSLNYDATYDLRTLDFTTFTPSRLLPHPSVRGIGYLLFATSSTAQGGIFSDPVMIGRGIRALDLDYSRVSFFADRDKVKDFRFGSFLQAVSARYGKGRILLFTDSTVFSNFYVFFAGRPEFALSSIWWLNRANRFPDLKFVFLLVSLLSLIMLLAVALKEKGKALHSLALGTLFGILFGFLLVRGIDGLSKGEITPHTAYTKIGFEREHSSFVMPLYGFQKFPEQSYHTFFLWTQRLGYVPKIFEQLEEALDQVQVLVIINPSRTFSQEEVEKMRNFLTDGGSLLLVLDPTRYILPSQDLVEKFGFTLEGETRLNPMVQDREGNLVASLENCGVVEGGEVVLTADEGIPVLSYKKIGEGIFAIFTSFSPFSDKSMGDFNVVPDEKQRKLHELEYWLINSLVGRDFSLLPGDWKRFLSED